MSDQTKQALCCECGTVRTCRRPRDYQRENYLLYNTVDPTWNRETGRLKCDTCGQITVHAIILPEGYAYRDHAEILRDLAHGWVRSNVTAGALDRIREKWRQGLPRNPYLHHLWWTSDVEAARQAGETRMLAICKTEIDVPKKVKKSIRSYAADELVEPLPFHDVDREDPATGLWWFDMKCVECLRRSNAIAIESQRRDLKARLQTIVDKIGTLDASTVAELLAQFEGGAT